jgi:two-component system, NarL family, response regulator NreC
MKVSDVAHAPVVRPKIRVILVEDHPVLRAGVGTLLRGEDDLEMIGEAENGLLGVQLALELRPEVVIMDVSLPQLGGVEATERIKGARPEQRILALSAHEDAGFARMLLDAGADGYALKRSACDELVRAVRIVAGGGSYIDPSLSTALGSGQRRGGARSGTMPTVSLSEREAEVIRLTAQGYTSKEIAQTLSLSPRTLETYKARAMAKLNLGSRAELIRYAVRCGWLRDP